MVDEEEAEQPGINPLGSTQAILQEMLNRHRATLLWKCQDLSEEQLRIPACEPSRLTLLGLVRHMTEVEYYWFESVFLGKDDKLGFFGSEEDPEGDFHDLESHQAEVVLARFRQACLDSEIVLGEASDLDQVAAKARSWDGRNVNLGYIVAHMLEEYARHNGHADLIRERIDGATGV